MSSLIWQGFQFVVAVFAGLGVMVLILSVATIIAALFHRKG